MADPVVPVQEPPQEVLWQCFRHLYHADIANAAMHFAIVRYSPLTFRVAETLWHAYPNYRVNPELRSVVLDLGEYQEDPGR